MEHDTWRYYSLLYNEFFREVSSFDSGLLMSCLCWSILSKISKYPLVWWQFLILYRYSEATTYTNDRKLYDLCIREVSLEYDDYKERYSEIKNGSKKRHYFSICYFSTISSTFDLPMNKNILWYIKNTIVKCDGLKRVGC